MNLLHFWPIYLGAFAAALPVLVHWLTRPRPEQLPLSTLRFLREVLQQRKARSRLRDFLILALRTAAVLLLAFAVARPLWRGQTAPAASETGQTARVVVLDVSQSMAAGARGIQHFERARARAAGHLAFQPGLRANLILAGAAPRAVFEQLSINLSSLHDALDRSRVEPQRLNLQGAIEAAGEMLAAAGTAPGQRMELVVISDMQRSNWAAPDFSSVPKETEIHLESVAPAETLPNLAVLRAGVAGSTTQGKPSRLEVEVGNFTFNMRPLHCEVTLGPAVYRLTGTCPAGGKTVLTQECELPSPGWQFGEARLIDADDALPADDARSFVINVRPPPVYALISRQSPDASDTSSFFLERALAPFNSPEHAAPVRVIRVDPQRLDAEALTGAQLLTLDHPGKLPPAALRLLANYVRRGRGLWYVASEPVDAVNLRQLAEMCGAGWQLPVEFTPPEPGHIRKNLFLAEVKREQAPFSVWGDSLSAAIGALRVGGGLSSRRLDTGLADDLVAAYSDRSAALVVSSCGAGAVAVLNADLTRSNLATSPMFVTLVAELADRLLGDRQRGVPVLSGEPLGVFLPLEAGGATGLVIEGPGVVGVNVSGINGAENDTAGNGAMPPPARSGSGQTSQYGRLSDEGDGLVWRAAAAGPPGIYRVRRGDTMLFALATEVPPEESDLTPLAADVLEGRLSGGRRVQFRAMQGSDQGVDDLWSKLATAAVICLLLEVAALRLFRT